MTTLTAHSVYAAALAVVDQQGPDKLTMRAVAAGLGVEAPSLYHHVPNKAALVDGIVIALVEEVAIPRPGKGREATVRAWARAWRKVLDRHPQAVRLVGARPSLALALLERSGTTLAELEAGGMPADDARDLLRSVLLFELGHAEIQHAGVDVAGASAWHDAAVRALVTGFGAQVGPAPDRGGDASGAHADEGVQDEAPAVDEASGDVEGAVEEGGEQPAATTAEAQQDAAGEHAAEEHTAEEHAAEEHAAEEHAPEEHAAEERAAEEHAPEEHHAEEPVAEEEHHAEEPPAAPSAAPPAEQPAAAQPPPPPAQPRPVAAAPPPRPTPQVRPAPEPPRRGGLRGRLRGLLGRGDD